MPARSASPHNPHAFFLCTDERDFAKLATSPYNVVLQKKPPPQDDGSLSRLAAARGVRYVNLEVGHRARRHGRRKCWTGWSGIWPETGRTTTRDSPAITSPSSVRSRRPWPPRP